MRTPRPFLLAMLVGLFATAAAGTGSAAAQDGADEWPELPVEWIAGPKPAKLPPTVELPQEFLRAPGALRQKGPALSAQAVSPVACGEVFGQQSDLVKQATRTNNADGTVTLRVQLNTSLPPESETRLRDCIWIDSTPNAQWDQATETLFAVDLAPAAFLPDNTTAANDSFIRFRVTITATAQDRVCDQGARSEDGDALPIQTPYLVRSNTLCLEGEPPFVIPEAAQVAFLSLSALAVVGGAYVVVRRRSTPLAA